MNAVGLNFTIVEHLILIIYIDPLCDEDVNKISILFILDLSEALDTINHSILIEPLNQLYGLNIKLLSKFR